MKYFNILILYQASNWVSRRFTGAELHLINLSYKGINSDTGHWGSGPQDRCWNFPQHWYNLQVTSIR